MTGCAQPDRPHPQSCLTFSMSLCFGIFQRFLASIYPIGDSVGWFRSSRKQHNPVSIRQSQPFSTQFKAWGASELFGTKKRDMPTDDVSKGLVLKINEHILK